MLIENAAVILALLPFFAFCGRRLFRRETAPWFPGIAVAARLAAWSPGGRAPLTAAGPTTLARRPRQESPPPQPTPKSPMSKSIPKPSAALPVPASIVLLGALLLGACAGTSRPTRNLSPEDRARVAREAELQAEMALTSMRENGDRLSRVALPIQQAAVPFCPDSRLRTRYGYRAVALESFPEEFRDAASRLYGIDHRVALLSVTPGSPMAEAGFRAGDRVRGVNGFAVRPGKAGLSDLDRRLRDGGSNSFRVARGVEEHLAEVTGLPVCGEAPVVLDGDSTTNAFTDGENTYLTQGMMGFVESDDELAMVVAHELGHIVAGHVQKKKRNALWGALGGALLDGLAARYGGVDTRGAYSEALATAASRKYSQDFENEADAIGAEILAAAGIDFFDAINFWRRISMESPGGVAASHSASHPSSPERFIRLTDLHGEFFPR